MSCGASEVVSIVCASEASTSQLLRTMSAQSSRAASSRVGQPDAWGHRRRTIRRCPLQREIEDFSRANIGPSAQQPSFRASTIMDAPFTLSPQHGRSLQGGDLGDTLAILLILTISFIGVCAFLGWYSRRRG